MTLAILCSGQGPQHPNMFALTGDAPEAADLFAHAAALLGGRDPREMVQTDTDAALHQNRVGQILCTVQALAAAATLRDAWPRRLIIAGYSVGEVAAWGVAGLVEANVTLDLVARRAEAMDAASAVGDGLFSSAASPATPWMDCASATMRRSPSSIPATPMSSAGLARRWTPWPRRRRGWAQLASSGWR